ncbi:cell cycle control protein cwf19 [Verticillium alfalfae VaMs.102]|uniref:Cell cycle control protein cwf19 n=1 Tax=Verticillium alfalfae (strain VaMs.102 / ATCC MYA-4576 / FGSC 10136) TaxID=526221 RepID=C9S885_VERA1|nr:cell cycle control protein cwf19 [Verticillium alfalfae VaMs.102]EEY15335.1 cell cycle control protein cwf19 [Verticillium alfalfae VaMs.102]
MDGLDDFEKALAAEKGERQRIEREKEERRQRKKNRHTHHHRDERDEPSERHRDKDRDRHRSHGSRRHDGEDDERRHRHHRSRHHNDDGDNGHRHKRSRHERDDDASESRHKRRRDDHHKTSDPKEDLPLPDEEKTPEIDGKPSAAPVRDAWMTAPSALDVDYVHRREKDQKPPPKEEPPRVIHEREINKEIDSPKVSLPDSPAERTFNYKFGDSGSQWRMMKLKAVYTAADQSGRTPEDVALERFGGLREFDDAREEKSELDRRQIYGEGYVGKEQPTGELYEERMAKLSITQKTTNEAPEELEQGVVIPDEPMQHTPMDQTTLNRLRAQMVKAKLTRAPNAAQLESEYNAAAASFATKGPQSVTLGAQDNRMLAGSRGEVKAVETKRGRERGNKLSRILDNCPLCYHEDKNQQPLAPVLSLGTRVYLTLATEPEVSPGGAVIAPLTHRKNLLECDDDEWEELRNFMKSLTRMYHDKGQEVIFYENAAAPHRHLHAAMIAVPIPYEEGAMVPAYFKEAFLSADEEWAQHRKVIDTGAKAAGGMGRMAFRRSIAKEMPYFHVWFTLDGGLGHIIENSDKWPRGDLFAREIVGGIMDVGPDVIKKQGRWRRDDTRVEGFQRGWRKFDWTRLLAEG